MGSLVNKTISSTRQKMGEPMHWGEILVKIQHIGNQGMTSRIFQPIVIKFKDLAFGN